MNNFNLKKMKPLLLDQCRVLKFSIYLITIGFLFLFQPDKNLIAGNKSKIQKIAIRVIEGQATFKLSGTEIDKIKLHIRNHYQMSKIAKKLSLLSEDHSERIFEKMTRKEGFDSLQSLKLVNFTLDCQAELLTKDLDEPELSVIQVKIKLCAFRKKDKNNVIDSSFVTFGEKIRYYYPTRVDSALAIFDTLIYKYLEPETKKVDLLMGAITIIAWKFLDCMIFKQKSKGKLPDAPIITEPSK